MSARIKEGSYYEVEASFFDETGAAVTPSKVRYQIWCLTSKRLVRDWTTVQTGSTVSIVATAADNAIQDDKNARETKQMVVQSNYGTTLQMSESTEWEVQNLRGFK